MHYYNITLSRVAYCVIIVDAKSKRPPLSNTPNNFQKPSAEKSPRKISDAFEKTQELFSFLFFFFELLTKKYKLFGETFGLLKTISSIVIKQQRVRCITVKTLQHFVYGTQKNLRTSNKHLLGESVYRPHSIIDLIYFLYKMFI